MDEFRAQLDALMGEDRNVPLAERDERRCVRLPTPCSARARCCAGAVQLSSTAACTSAVLPAPIAVAVVPDAAVLPLLLPLQTAVCSCNAAHHVWLPFAAAAGASASSTTKMCASTTSAASAPTRCEACSPACLLELAVPGTAVCAAELAGSRRLAQRQRRRLRRRQQQQ